MKPLFSALALACLMLVLPVGPAASQPRVVPRDPAEERTRWHAEDAADPRADQLTAKYGWHGVSMALILRPRHTLNNAEFLGGLDVPTHVRRIEW